MHPTSPREHLLKQETLQASATTGAAVRVAGGVVRSIV